MKSIILTLMIITAVATLTTVALVLADYPTMAAIIGVTTFFLWLALLVTATVVVTAWWTRQTMREGASIALQAQTVNDQWDAQKTKAFASLAGTMLRLSDQRPALPLPQQSWLPELSEFEGAGDGP